MNAPKKVTKAEIVSAVQEWRKTKAKTRQLKAPSREEALRIIYLEANVRTENSEQAHG